MTQGPDTNLSTADLAYGRNTETTQDRREDRETTTDAERSEAQPLLADSGSYQGRWQEIQTKFVDEPQASVREADSLVAEIIQELARKFAEQREQLENRWSSGSDVSTEDLRQALQQYRSFFQRLLAA